MTTRQRIQAEIGNAKVTDAKLRKAIAALQLPSDDNYDYTAEQVAAIKQQVLGDIGGTAPQTPAQHGTQHGSAEGNTASHLAAVNSVGAIAADSRDMALQLGVADADAYAGAYFTAFSQRIGKNFQAIEQHKRGLFASMVQVSARYSGFNPDAISADMGCATFLDDEAVQVQVLAALNNVSGALTSATGHAR